jgi:hypothetical protein
MIISMSNQEFILCYRKPHGLHWECEQGYQSVTEVNERTFELLNKDSHLTTTFFPTSLYTPMVFRQLRIQSALSPRVTMYNKPKNGERGGPIVPPTTLKQDEIKHFPKPKGAYY